MEITIHQIKPEERNNLKKWGKTLMTTRKAEAEGTLSEENLKHETAFLVEIEGKTYFLGIMESDGEVKQANSQKKINQKHQSVLRKALKEKNVATSELIYNLHAPSQK